MENTTKTLAGIAAIGAATIAAHAYIHGLVSNDNLRACVETAMDNWAEKHDWAEVVRVTRDAKERLPDHERRISYVEGAVSAGKKP